MKEEDSLLKVKDTLSTSELNEPGDILVIKGKSPVAEHTQKQLDRFGDLLKHAAKLRLSKFRLNEDTHTILGRPQNHIFCSITTTIQSTPTSPIDGLDFSLWHRIWHNMSLMTDIVFGSSYKAVLKPWKKINEIISSYWNEFCEFVHFWKAAKQAIRTWVNEFFPIDHTCYVESRMDHVFGQLIENIMWRNANTAQTLALWPRISVKIRPCLDVLPEIILETPDCSSSLTLRFPYFLDKEFHTWDSDFWKPMNIVYSYPLLTFWFTFCCYFRVTFCFLGRCFHSF